MSNKINTTGSYSSDFRIPGEWEKQQSVLFHWHLTPFVQGYDLTPIYVELTKALSAQIKVMINTASRKDILIIESILKNQQIATHNIEFLTIDSGTKLYPRDYGAECMVDNTGQVIHLDMTFGAYGFGFDENTQKTDVFAKQHAKHVGIPSTKRINYVGEHGNHEFNGHGVMMTVEKTVLNRNPGRSKKDLATELQKIFNLTKIIWLPEGLVEDEDPFTGYLPFQNGKVLRAGSANGHTDEFCRFVGPNTVLLAEVTTEEANRDKLHALNKTRLDKCYAVLKKAIDHKGKPLQIIRIPVPEHEAIRVKPGDQPFDIYAQGATECDHQFDDGSTFPDITKPFTVLAPLSYCNFLMSNNLVIGQSYYSAGKSKNVKNKDQQAKEILQSVFPNRKIVMINTLALNFGGGGIHCCTRNIPIAS